MKKQNSRDRSSIKNVALDPECEISITRLLNAPRALVFNVWTDPKHFAKWMGPNGVTSTIHTMDVRRGGVLTFTMHGPNGINYPNKIVFKVVVEPELLVYSHCSGSENDPGQLEVTVTFRAQGKKTELTMRGIFNSKEQRDIAVEKFGALEGSTQTMDRLEECIAQLNVQRAMPQNVIA